jgi:hypothetical protein
MFLLRESINDPLDGTDLAWVQVYNYCNFVFQQKAIDDHHENHSQNLKLYWIHK